MSRELLIKKCAKCGATVKVIEDCHCGDCGIQCCGEEMKPLIPNSVDAAVEKHVPKYEIKDKKIYVTVNHVMDDDHYIEWISVVADNKECTKYLQPGKEAKMHCKYTPNSVIYAYCNKHGLWKIEVE